jgi:hypothetical protein
MKITKSELRQIIKEELLNEYSYSAANDGRADAEAGKNPRSKFYQSHPDYMEAYNKVRVAKGETEVTPLKKEKHDLTGYDVITNMKDCVAPDCDKLTFTDRAHLRLLKDKEAKAKLEANPEEHLQALIKDLESEEAGLRKIANSGYGPTTSRFMDAQSRYNEVARKIKKLLADNPELKDKLKK